MGEDMNMGAVVRQFAFHELIRDYDSGQPGKILFEFPPIARGKGQTCDVLVREMQRRLPIGPPAENLDRSSPHWHPAEPTSLAVRGILEEAKAADPVLMVSIVVQVDTEDLVSIKTKNASLRAQSADQVILQIIPIEEKDSIWLECFDSLAESSSSSRPVEGVAIEGNGFTRKGEFFINLPAREELLKLGIEEAHRSAPLLQPVDYVEGIYPTPTGWGPIEGQINESNAG